MLKNNKILFPLFISEMVFPGDTDTIQAPSSVYASSVAYGSSRNYVDLTKYPTKTWQARYNNNQYVTFNYPQQLYIVAVEVKGDRGYYVKSFYVKYYDDMTKSFLTYKVRLCRSSHL